jgi:D-beta-D-heptose 7-phosphate kinase/D-beta-D-heptose 1-phosphate adenosyltransferase
MSDGPVLFFGDAIVDSYIKSDPDKLDQTTAVPYGDLINEWNAPGGVCNAALTAAALGLDVVIVGMQDDSCWPSELIDYHPATRHSDVLYDMPVMSSSWTQPRKWRLVDTDHRLLARWDRPLDRPNTDEVQALMCEALERRCREHPPSIVVVSDYGKGVVGHEACELLTRLQHEHEYQLILDPHVSNAHIYRTHFNKCTKRPVFMPNLATCIAITDSCWGQATPLARNLPAAFHKYMLVITEGRHGLTWKTPGGDPTHTPPFPVTAVDPCGASDAVAAGLAWAFSKPHARIYGNRIAEAATAAGALAVTKPGTQVVWEYELYRKLAKDRGRICNLCYAGKLADSVKLDNGKVNVTNGVFDLMHEGHRKVLRAAGEDAFLIVLVNSDESTARIKGSGRPIQRFIERAKALTALDCVDAVVEFSDDTPEEAIKRIQPHELWKDNTRATEEIPGAAHAGEVRFVGHSMDSTTSVIKRILARQQDE